MSFFRRMIWWLRVESSFVKMNRQFKSFVQMFSSFWAVTIPSNSIERFCQIFSKTLQLVNCHFRIGKIAIFSLFLGSSVDQLIHYAQGINSAKFRMFDFGLTKNLLRYGSLSPPNYDLKSVTAPVFLHYSDNDWMAAVRDVDELASKLGNLFGKFRVPDAKFNHLDYTYATDADTLLYNRVISFMDRYWKLLVRWKI